MIALLCLGIVLGFGSGVGLVLFLWDRAMRRDLEGLGRMRCILDERETPSTPATIHEIRGDWK
jgi:hypothetical protein